MLTGKCLELIQQIPKGKVTTYKIIAKKLNAKSYRAIGQIMKRNPKPIAWPCHRVVMSSGDVGGYLFGKDKKIELLRQEGLEISGNKVTNMADKIFFF